MTTVTPAIARMIQQAGPFAYAAARREVALEAWQLLWAIRIALAVAAAAALRIGLRMRRCDFDPSPGGSGWDAIAIFTLVLAAVLLAVMLINYQHLTLNPQYAAIRALLH